MENQTYVKFHILPFSAKAIEKPLIIGIFSTMYLTVITLNSIVIALICLDVHLHTPMYLFFCNLSTIDIWYTTVVIPKLLYIYLSGNDMLSSTQCFTQIYFFIISTRAEVILFFVMGFDRYVAICHPLTYHQILSKKICILIMVIIWVLAFLNSSLFLTSLLTLPFYEVVSIHNFFRNAIEVFNASCNVSKQFNTIIYVESVLFGLCPLLCNFLSYGRIIHVILRIKSKEGRRKAFSTCLSHLIVMTTYYSTSAIVYMMLSSGHTVIIKQILSVFYTIVVPMINPLIYSLRSNEIMTSCKKLLKVK